MLESKCCKKDVSPANPADSSKHHKCKLEALAAAGAGSSTGKQPGDEQQDPVGMPVAKKAATTMDCFTASAAQLKSFHRLFTVHLSGLKSLGHGSAGRRQQQHGAD